MRPNVTYVTEARVTDEGAGGPIRASEDIFISLGRRAAAMVKEENGPASEPGPSKGESKPGQPPPFVWTPETIREAAAALIGVIKEFGDRFIALKEKEFDHEARLATAQAKADWRVLAIFLGFLAFVVGRGPLPRAARLLRHGSTSPRPEDGREKSRSDRDV